MPRDISEEMGLGAVSPVLATRGVAMGFEFSDSPAWDEFSKQIKEMIDNPEDKEARKVVAVARELLKRYAANAPTLYGIVKGNQFMGWDTHCGEYDTHKCKALLITPIEQDGGDQ